MDWNLFTYCTMGRRAELEAGMAGKRPELFQRMLDELAEYTRFADQAGYAGFGHPEHHLQIEGFEASNDPNLMAMWFGQHSERLRVITCGYVTTTHNPLRTAENIATLDHMLGGRFGVGLVRGYQSRWVESFRVREDVGAVGRWNKGSDMDERNREYFSEFVEIVLTALREETFSYRGKFWDFPPPDHVNPHPHTVYTEFGRGVDPDWRIREVGIAPRPLQQPHPPLYGGFTFSLQTAMFWARYGGKPIVLSPNYEFCESLWQAYREEAERHDRSVAPGDEAAWGGIMICCDSDAEAEAWMNDYRWFWDQWAEQFGQHLPALLVGSPDTISREIERARASVPINEGFLLIPSGIHTRDQILSSLERFSEKVIPRFA